MTFRQISKNKNLSVQNKNNNVAFVIDVTINNDGNSFTSNFTRFLTSWVGRIDTGIKIHSLSLYMMYMETGWEW